MIEISDKKFWLKKCTYQEMELYLKFLEIDGKKGWRIFRDRKEHELTKIFSFNYIWYQVSDRDNEPEKRICIPVRDL